jgi:hypothetical protein
VRRRAFPSAVEACSIVPGQLEAAGVVGAAGVFVHERLAGDAPATGVADEEGGGRA